MAERPPAAEVAAGAPEPTPAAAQEEAGADGATPEPAPQAEPTSGEEDTNPAAALAAAQAAAAANEDKFLRARADLENYRRRVGRERAEIAQEAKREVLLRVLEVLDNLERALGYEQAGDQVDAQALLMGLRMTVTQFEGVLSGLGVQVVAARGGAVRSALARGRGDGRGPGASGGHHRRGDTARLPPRRRALATGAGEGRRGSGGDGLGRRRGTDPPPPPSLQGGGYRTVLGLPFPGGKGTGARSNLR